MRELSVIELDLIVGGYGSGYDYGSSSVVDNGNGTFSGTVYEADAQAMGASATAAGIDWGIDVKVGNGGSWSVGGSVKGKS